MVEHLTAFHPLRGTYRLRRLQRPPADEDRQPAEHRALGWTQQLVTPVDQGMQGLLARQRAARAAGEQAKALVEPVQQRLRAHGAQANGGQLQRQREAVQPPADRHQRSGSGQGHLEIGIGGQGAVEEEGDRLVRTDAFAGVADTRCLRRQRQCRHAVAGSPSTRSTSRLVQSSVTPGQARNSVSATCAHASTRCSQLSGMSSRRLSARYSVSTSSAGRAGSGGTCSACNMAVGICAGSLMGARSTNQAPSR